MASLRLLDRERVLVGEGCGDELGDFKADFSGGGADAEPPREGSDGNDNNVLARFRGVSLSVLVAREEFSWIADARSKVTERRAGGGIAG